MLDAELETLAADATAGEISRASHHALPPGTPCRNCATPLAGAWCHACGQKGDDFHRSIGHLVAEAFEGLTHFDGRFWNTLPRLVIKPALLTNDYLQGKRVSQIPPFRLYLVVLLLVFFTGSLGNGHNAVNFVRPEHSQVGKDVTNDLKKDGVDTTTHISRAELDQKLKAKIDPLPGGPWLRERIVHAVENPESVGQAMEHWSHRFAILFLPIAAVLLSMIYAFRRKMFMFDHLILSMHSLSFQGLLLSAFFALNNLFDAGVLLFAAPVHLFVHLRGVYRGGVVATLLRMAVLFVGSSIAFGCLMAVLAIVGLATAH